MRERERSGKLATFSQGDWIKKKADGPGEKGKSIGPKLFLSIVSPGKGKQIDEE